MGFASNVAKFLLGGQKVPFVENVQTSSRNGKRSVIESASPMVCVLVDLSIQLNPERQTAKCASRKQSNSIGSKGARRRLQSLATSVESVQAKGARNQTFEFSLCTILIKMEQNTVENLEAEAEPACTSN